MKQLTAIALVMTMLSTATKCVVAQSVILPAPRLLTTSPMGGQAGTTVDVTLTGEYIDGTESLLFSHPAITAVPKLNEAGLPLENEFVVTIAEDCPLGVHEARVMSRLGVSSSRAFSVGALPEMVREKPNTTLETATEISVNTIVNASTTRQAIDYFVFAARKDQRIVIDCAAKRIDSKLKAVFVLADADGNDLQVERQGGMIDYRVPADGRYVMKVFDLTYQGGKEFFYRLAVHAAEPDAVVQPQPGTQLVSSFSWPPTNLKEDDFIAEVEPNDSADAAQQVTLPCAVTGSFAPAADVDTFEFVAKKGDVWWVEVASERLGRPTDPTVVVQHVEGDQVTDLAELTDIGHPIKVSSNGYSYDGPPYHAGSPDVLGKLEIQQDGRHRLQLSDLFGGTRNDPRNIYRLVIRRAQPDFAIVGWALHMTLRNGDRNALSKPIALRGGTTMPFEIAVVRRDGFDGPIDLTLENLPAGVTATGFTIPAGQTRGILLITAAPDAPRGLTMANFFGTAQIDGETVKRRGRWASMAWPVPNAWSEIPAPRLLAQIPVSVNGSELAPVTVAAQTDQVWEVVAGKQLSIPLSITRREEFSGSKMSVQTFGSGFDRNPAFDIPLDADQTEVVLDTAALKTPPGDYPVAFYGSAVAKYRYHPEAVPAAERALQLARDKVTSLQQEMQSVTEELQTATDAEKSQLQEQLGQLKQKLQAAQSAVQAAEQELRAAETQAKPKDIVDIVVSTPIQVRVLPQTATETP